MAKALVLLSGGLDSLLAVKVLQAQGIEVAGICFTSNFFNCAKAQVAAAQLGIDLKIVDINKEILGLVKNPPSGYGKNLNPCIDCHSLMMKKAGSVAKQEKYDFIATGEVLGQRPFSQNKIALEKVAKLAGTEVLRPLSAKLLPETGIEKQGLAKRGRLLDLSGRDRARQLELAHKYKIKEFPMPAGGCLLTDPEFSERLLKMLEYWPDCDNNDVALLKNGRIFWLNLKMGGESKKVLAIIGRNEAENNRLTALAKKGDFVVELMEETGPISLLRINAGFTKPVMEPTLVPIPAILKLPALDLGSVKDLNTIVGIVKLLDGYYSPKLRGRSVTIGVKIV